jgi:hypothetical protein
MHGLMIFQGATCNQPTLNSVEMQAEQQVIQDAAQAPHVHPLVVITVAHVNFRRAVLGRHCPHSLLPHERMLHHVITIEDLDRDVHTG